MRPILNNKDDVSTIHLVEALLFLENRPVNIKYMEKLTGRKKEEIKKCIHDLEQKYRQIGSSLRITENDQSDYQMSLRQPLFSHLGQYYDSRKKVRFSNASLETLAIIAYKQPVTRVEIEKIRGVHVSQILKFLLEQKLVQFAGKKDAPGKPNLYKTTDHFLNYFGLLSLKDLPSISEFEKS